MIFLCSHHVHSLIENTFKRINGLGAFEPAKQINLNRIWLRRMNLPALLFQVKRISEDPPCKCPSKFCVERLSQGRYRVGEKILFIRVNFHFSLDSLFSWAYTELELRVTGKIWPVTKQELPRWCLQLGLKTWGMEILLS